MIITNISNKNIQLIDGTIIVPKNSIIKEVDKDSVLHNQLKNLADNFYVSIAEEEKEAIVEKVD